MAITRKNFMFVGSDRGGDRTAVFYTLIETAKLNGLDPEAYIATIIDRMAAGHVSKRLEQNPTEPSRRGFPDAAAI